MLLERHLHLCYDDATRKAVCVVGVVLPNSLVRQPASITLVVSIVIRSLQLGRGGDGGAVLHTRGLGLLKRQGVAGGDGPVVEHDTWGTVEGSNVCSKVPH